MMAPRASAPGGPGVEPRWTSSAKAAVGTALGARSMVWFTISHGIVNEVYYPRVDHANTRDLGLIVTAAPDFFSEEKRHTRHDIDTVVPGVPEYRVVNTCEHDRYRITKLVLTDPERNVLLQDVRFEALSGALDDYRMYVLLAPHLGNRGADNNGWLGDYKGTSLLYAQRDAFALALGCSAGFAARSCGYVGVNDGWQQLSRHGRLTDCYASATHGNIALTGEVDLATCGGHFLLAVGFGRDPDEAGLATRAALEADFDTVCAEFVDGWRRFHAKTRALGASDEAAYRRSVAVLESHEDKVRRGAFIASLSIPWGNAHGDDDFGGYHLTWTRDLVEIAGALLAAGQTDVARNAVHYLMSTQNADGHWPQNMWLDGRHYWSGIQLDEAALPILLADNLRRRRALRRLDPWPMVRRAAGYLARHGPATPEDRWEEEGGYSVFTLAVEIAALLTAADFADAAGDTAAAAYLRQTADIWNESVEHWTYVSNTPLAREVGVGGYYVRIAPASVDNGAESSGQLIPVLNHRGSDRVPYSAMVSPDALALVRFGLRTAWDPRIRDTLQVIDALLRSSTSTGPAWHRYNGDGYGEHEDGSPFDGWGVGRCWPVLGGERAHYELAAGDEEVARCLLDIMQRQTGPGGLIPEQIWDADDIPARSLFNGCPSGSAMPLVWAHAEYVKLIRSLHDGRIFDTPPQTVARYIKSGPPAVSHAAWRFNNKIRVMPSGRELRLEVRAPVIVHWTVDDWRTSHDTEGTDTTLGVWVADLPVASLPTDSIVRFTFYWPEARHWEGTDFSVRVDEPRPRSTRHS